MSTVESVIEEFCNEYGYGLRDDYSGRCMFGETCIGIISDNTTLTCMQLTDYLSNNGCEDIIRKLGTPRTDNMGMSYIVYFPDFHE